MTFVLVNPNSEPGRGLRNLHQIGITRSMLEREQRFWLGPSQSLSEEATEYGHKDDDGGVAREVAGFC